MGIRRGGSSASPGGGQNSETHHENWGGFFENEVKIVGLGMKTPEKGRSSPVGPDAVIE